MVDTKSRPIALKISMNDNTVSVRSMVIVWFTAIAFAIGLCLGLPALAQWTVYIRPLPFAVFVGDSLFAHAVPPRLPASQIFRAADTSAYINRPTKDGLTDREVISRLHLAVTAQVPKIYVELNPLITDLTPYENTFAAQQLVWRFSSNLRSSLLQVLGIDNDEDDLAATFSGKIDESLYSSPHAHAPRYGDEISREVERARDKNLKLTFVLLPRSEAAARYLGSQFESDVKKAADAFSLEYGVSVWKPAPFWPNNFFKDQGHLNARGREFFLARLRQFESGLPPK